MKLSKVKEKIAGLAAKAESITRNKFIIAIVLLYQGIMFLIKPENTLKGLAAGIAIAAAIAAAGIIIGYIASGNFNKENIVPIITAFAAIAVCILIVIFSSYLSKPFQYLVALAVVANGVMGILDVFHIKKLREAIALAKRRLPGSNNAALNEIRAAADKAASQQKEFLTKPMDMAGEKTGGLIALTLIINIAVIAVGILMIFYQAKTNAVIVRISGAIMVISAASDIIIGIRAGRIAKEAACATAGRPS